MEKSQKKFFPAEKKEQIGRFAPFCGLVSRFFGFEIKTRIGRYRAFLTIQSSSFETCTYILSLSANSPEFFLSIACSTT